jgi:hypothetical protein
MANGSKVLINLATGMEDAERVLVAFLVATAAQTQGSRSLSGPPRTRSGSAFPA